MCDNMYVTPTKFLKLKGSFIAKVFNYDEGTIIFKKYSEEVGHVLYNEQTGISRMVGNYVGDIDQLECLILGFSSQKAVPSTRGALTKLDVLMIYGIEGLLLPGDVEDAGIIRRILGGDIEREDAVFEKLLNKYNAMNFPEILKEHLTPKHGRKEEMCHKRY